MYNEDYRQVNGLASENIILKQLHFIYYEKALLQSCRYDPLVKTWDRSYHVNKSQLACECLNVYFPLNNVFQ